MKIPEPLNTITAKIDQYHESIEGKPRPHMGVSMLGHHCDRYLWLAFRWTCREKFDGRMLRLFRRGHKEESLIVSDLRAIGIDIRDTEYNQSRVKFGSHVEGSLDGVIYSGVPEAPDTVHIAEFKTHGKKSFDLLVKEGLEKAKPMHFIQMQCYMFGKDIDRGLYLAVCKDDDRIYTERVALNKDIALKYIERGRRLATDNRIPPPISKDPSWYQCKFCPAYGFCHENKPAEEKHCRSCVNAQALPDSTWHCAKWECTIPTDVQYDGCAEWEGFIRA